MRLSPIPPCQVRFRTQQEALRRAYANDDLKPSRYARNLRLQTLKARTPPHVLFLIVCV